MELNKIHSDIAVKFDLFKFKSEIDVLNWFVLLFLLFVVAVEYCWNELNSFVSKRSEKTQALFDFKLRKQFSINFKRIRLSVEGKHNKICSCFSASFIIFWCCVIDVYFSLLLLIQLLLIELMYEDIDDVDDISILLFLI